MRATLYLAWRYVAYHRLKTGLMIAAVTITLLLPAALSVLIGTYNQRLHDRARRTPLVLGPAGNDFELTLRALYFRGGTAGTIAVGLSDAISDEGLADAIPLHAVHTDQSGRVPIVGVGFDYFAFRGLSADHGRLPGTLGEAVIGAAAAQTLGVDEGDTIYSERTSSLDLMGVQVALSVVGVLAPTDGPDDGAIFVDIKTAWVIDGLGHGHEDVTDPGVDPSVVLGRDDESVTANAALPEATDVTRANLETFHFHGDRATYPITAALVTPRDTKGETILINREYGDSGAQLLRPADVVADLMGIVFRVKRFFDANFALLSVSTVLFLALVVALSMRLRAREVETLHKIGGGRWLVARLQIAELAIVLCASAVAASAVVAALLPFAPDLLRIL